MDDVIYAHYPVFRSTPELRAMPDADRTQACHDADVLLKEWEDRVTVRGAYSTAGFRADADLMMWWVARSPADVQDLLVAFRRTELGRRLELTWAFMGAVRPAEFTADHAPAFVKGDAPRTYLCVYPFVRTPEWYLLPPDERGRLLRDHGVIGREYPDVLANTTSAFGINDWEWILAFEADDLIRILDCIRALRAAEARRYTKVEVPFVTGIRKEPAQAFQDLA
ncbi:MAG TPA: hydrogen peroxide-dependent heme synthase [Actinomycetota bacterium]